MKSSPKRAYTSPPNIKQVKGEKLSCEIATFDQMNSTLSAKQRLCRMLDCMKCLADAWVTLWSATALIHICQSFLWTRGWWCLPRSSWNTVRMELWCAPGLGMWVVLLVWWSLDATPSILVILCSWTLPPAMPPVTKMTFQLLWWAASCFWRILPLVLWKSV